MLDLREFYFKNNYFVNFLSYTKHESLPSFASSSVRNPFVERDERFSARLKLRFEKCRQRVLPKMLDVLSLFISIKPPSLYEIILGNVLKPKQYTESQLSCVKPFG